MSDSLQTLHCAWLVRCGKAPLADQKIVVENGHLVDTCDCPADERSALRPIALLPALVNPHAHLEFSSLTEPLPPPSPFPDWIKSVVHYRRSQMESERNLAESIHRGLNECVDSGTSVIGEICTSDEGAHQLSQALKSQPASTISVCFRELLGFTQNRISEQDMVAEKFVDSFESLSDSPSIIAALSPHAPYSVHPEIVQHASQLACQNDLPIAMHLAETQDEIQFLETRSGRFVEFLDALGLWQPESLSGIAGIADYLQMIKECPHALAIHGNYFNEADIRLLGSSPNITTVYCVRTHRWFGHENHPWRRIEEAGGNVILGTDSRASNPDLSIWKELQAFCQHSNQSILQRLPMISTKAASALGMDPESVNLQIGRPFCGSVIQVNAESESALLAALLMSDNIQSAARFLS